jgi:hypothetical protein
LHTCDNTDGCERLVVVELLAATPRPESLDLSFRTRTVEPASRDSSPVDLAWQPAEVSLPPAGTEPLRIYAGRPIPCNRNEFVIPYELRGRRGVIHGGLCGDEVILGAE